MSLHPAVWPLVNSRQLAMPDSRQHADTADRLRQYNVLIMCIQQRACVRLLNEDMCIAMYWPSTIASIVLCQFRVKSDSLSILVNVDQKILPTTKQRKRKCVLKSIISKIEPKSFSQYDLNFSKQNIHNISYVSTSITCSFHGVLIT